MCWYRANLWWSFCLALIFSHSLDFKCYRRMQNDLQLYSYPPKSQTCLQRPPRRRQVGMVASLSFTSYMRCGCQLIRHVLYMPLLMPSHAVSRRCSFQPLNPCKNWVWRLRQVWWRWTEITPWHWSSTTPICSLTWGESSGRAAKGGGAAQQRTVIGTSRG